MIVPVDDRTGTGDGVLERFLADIVVDDYAAAPAQRGTSARDGAATPRSSRTGTVMAVGVALLIGLMVAAALANTRLSSAERQQTRAQLLDRIALLSGTVDARQANVDEATGEVQALQDRLLAASENGPATADSIAALSGLAGASPAAGPGVTVTVDDAKDAEAGSLNRVLDRDLQDIVNQLWRAGAGGVSINGQRLTGTTAIRAAGEAILVNYQPLARPYAVSALGARDALAEGSGLQRLLRQLSRDYGLVTDAQSSDVALPAGDVRTPRYASVVPGATPAGGVPSTGAGGGP